MKKFFTKIYNYVMKLIRGNNAPTNLGDKGLYYDETTGKIYMYNSSGQKIAINKGPQGPQGERGPQGPKGDSGSQGDTGPQGVKGDLGPQGVKGDLGPQGIKGDIGQQGVKGDTGQQGVKGDTGQQGVKGDTGQQGVKGDLGPQGIKGDLGPQGVKGDIGPQGPQGVMGLLDNAQLTLLTNRLQLLEDLAEVSDYIADEYPEAVPGSPEITTTGFKRWDAKPDILNYDYDGDGLFSSIDYAILDMVTVKGETACFSNDPNYDATNKTYNGCPLDMNDDGVITISDIMVNVNNAIAWKHSSCIDISMRDQKYGGSRIFNSVLGDYIDTYHKYPSLEEFDEYWVSEQGDYINIEDEND